MSTLPPPLEPVLWGVWLPGLGWFRPLDHSDVFATTDFGLAETAARLYGAGARTERVDQSLIHAEPVLLERERLAQAAHQAAQAARPAARCARWWRSRFRKAG